MAAWPTQTRVNKESPRYIIDIDIVYNIIYCLSGTIHHFGRTLYSGIILYGANVYTRHNTRNTRFIQIKNACFA